MCDCHDLGDHEDLFRDEDILYRRVLDRHVEDGKVIPAHCPTKQWKEGLSCDWSVIASPQEAAKELSYLLTFTVGQCKALNLDVRYCPHVNPDHPFYNLAHCLLVLSSHVSRPAIAKVREKFLEVAVLRPTESEPEPKWRVRVFQWIRSWFCS